MPALASRFANRVAFVTGAASGIGASTARCFGAEGAVVYCADRDEQGAQRTAAEIRSGVGSAFALSLDVTIEDQWKASIEHVVATSGQLDVLVNSAGVSFSAPVYEMALADWRRVFAVNLDGVFLGTKYAWRAMAPRGGSIVNVSSASGIRAAAGASAYSTSKAAVGMFTRAVAKECRDAGLPIRVNAVAPAGVKTPMWTTMTFFQELVTQHGSEEAAFQVLASRSATGRFAAPDEVSQAILYLASDDAAMITGVELVVDGGYIL
jgi:NAD(P)-dependent dehydrogenase (short-subunit alcohol dehydrogenase family)